MSGGGNIQTGPITGTVIAVGAGASANMQMGGAEHKQIADLIAQLRQDIASSGLNQGAKDVLAHGAVADLAAAANAGKPDGVVGALKRADETLQAAGATVDHVAAIAATLGKIAKMAGVAFSVAAPFVAAML
jgi:hypothetical protein